MTQESADSRRFVRVPLHVLAAAGTTLLLGLVAVVLAWSSYRNTREVVSSTVDESIRHVSLALRGKIRGILRPAENQLDLLAFNEITRAATQEARLAGVPMAAAVLGSNPLLDTWYVGYPDGAFVLFRALRTATQRGLYRAPENASLMVQSIDVGGDGRSIGQYIFFDGNNRLLRSDIQPGYQFDPRKRPWYQLALGATGSVLTEPYLFYTNHQIGITMALEARHAGVVVGLDATLREIGNEISDLKLTPGTRVVVTDSGGKLIAVDGASAQGPIRGNGGEMHMAWLSELGIAALDAAQLLPREGVQRHEARLADGEWELISIPVPLQTSNKAYRVLMAVPSDELFGQARKLLMRQWWLILGLIVMSIPVGYWLTQLVVRPLRQLADETHRVASFDFSPSALKRSRIAEVDMLTNATGQMRSTIARFLDVSAALNSDLRLERLLEVVLNDLVATTSARSGAIYLFDPDTDLLHRSQFRGAGAAEYEAVLDLASDHKHPAVQAERLRRSVAGRLQAAGPELFAVPLETLGKEFVGVLLLELSHELAPDSVARRDPVVAFIEALSSTAAVAIETRRLVDSQKALLEAMIQLLAGAIDAKSPYTGGHCQRVPELTRRLAEAAHEDDTGTLRDFRLTPALREAVHVGSWLHDCGKVTTPEYVVDKATKLETLHNRIHEIRMRFEVLKRDAEIGFWKSQVAGESDAAARAGLHAAWSVLDEEFAFIASCNRGTESMDDESIRRLEQIAQRQWLRTLDDRLGLSREEERQREGIAVVPVPAVEQLLADKPEHIEQRAAQELIPADNPWGFRMEVPARKFNRGEVYNLSVRRGTLTAEERYIINDHIVQTIIMLERLPFPRHLRCVPEIAGGHHEKMDGTGYPKRLKGAEMSVPARIMAIADVFEALTAADRPYKSAKTLSESLRIMARMVREQHLDGELFALFLRSGVYLDYARQYLLPEQIDAVDEASLLV